MIPLQCHLSFSTGWIYEFRGSKAEPLIVSETNRHEKKNNPPPKSDIKYFGGFQLENLMHISLSITAPHRKAGWMHLFDIAIWTSNMIAVHKSCCRGKDEPELGKSTTPTPHPLSSLGFIVFRGLRAFKEGDSGIATAPLKSLSLNDFCLPSLLLHLSLLSEEPLQIQDF